jgi:hypothetical protein
MVVKSLFNSFPSLQVAVKALRFNLTMNEGETLLDVLF